MTGGQVWTRMMIDGSMSVELRGRFDMACAKGLGDQLSAHVLAERPRDVVIDLGAVSFMHDTTLCALTQVQHTTDSVGASLRVVNPGPFADRLPGITGAGVTLERQPVGV